MNKSTSSTQYMKRLYDPRAFFGQLSAMIFNSKDMREAGKAGRVSKEFSERIMMAVTEVNGCRYCSYYHTQISLKVGLKEDEIHELLSGEFENAPENEIAALYFAQHYAESGGNPQAEAVDCLRQTYGEAMARDILAYIRMIMIGNSWGNAFDALQVRFKGEPAQRSSILSELGVIFGLFWMLPVILVKKLFAKWK